MDWTHLSNPLAPLAEWIRLTVARAYCSPVTLQTQQKESTMITVKKNAKILQTEEQIAASWDVFILLTDK